jgi:hypothetical protein
MEPGFRVLTDLSKLKFMERSCVAYIGQIMDLFNAKGIGAVTRIVSDQKNGRAFTILAHFHYKPDVHIEVVESESEARQSLQNQFS